MRPTSNPPHPFALVEGMRSIGYTPPTALADLIDNSITAGATEIRVQITPPNAKHPGTVVVQDNGKGMSQQKLFDAMRWGGNGPSAARETGDLGRFGLGMKTASFSMGKRLTVATRAKKSDPVSVLCWDLDHVIKHGWEMTEKPDKAAEGELAKSELLLGRWERGTVVVVSDLDRLEVRATLQAHSDRNHLALTKRVTAHLGMVFHRFIEKGITIKLGASAVLAWDPFEGSTKKASESLADGVIVNSFILPHHSMVSDEAYDRLAGPFGWTAHQGFMVYRADRLIVPGGWLRLFSPEESCKLARIRIDLPNALDAGWKLNVMKSTVAPPSWQLNELQRIGDATRRHAMAVYNFRGERQAPSTKGSDDDRPFWNQESDRVAVRFKINRAHPVVQALKQSVRQPKIAESFLRAFERLLPLDAILQDPKRTTNGTVHHSPAEEVDALLPLAKEALRVLRSQGMDKESAAEVLLAAEPFVFHAAEIRQKLM